jgi:uncharacterized membrane protein YjjB (DUF3815 family)
VSLFTKYPSLFFTVYSQKYVCALLFVIPGFPIVTGGLDIAKLNFSAGIARLAYASAILISAISISWVFSYFTDIEPALFTATNISHTLLIVFRVIASFVGVFGFAIMFNSPISTAVQAALVGALCNTLRLEWISNTNIYPAIATCLACVLVGLIAKPLCERNNFAIPRIELTVSATIIMVPGTLLYRETYLLGISTYVPAEYLLNALLVILAIPMGLAIARFLTDKSWRKN